MEKKKWEFAHKFQRLVNLLKHKAAPRPNIFKKCYLEEKKKSTLFFSFYECLCVVLFYFILSHI